MGFTNFCCRSGGSNLNAGTRTGDTTEPGTSADFTYVAGNSNGTSVFTAPAGSNPQTDGVAVGDWGSVYLNAATVAVFIGRVSAVTSTTITFNTTAKSGTFPVSGTGNVTCKIGGAWAGPNGSSGFPLSFMTNNATNGSAQPVRINMKNAASYSISTVITYTNSSGVCTEGYSSSYGDGGIATIDGSTNAIVLLSFAGAGKIKNIKFLSSATTGTNAGVTMGIAGATLERCIVTGTRSNGITITGAVNVIGCEVYGTNTANGSGAGGISCGGTGSYVADCICHDNTGSNNCGIQVSAFSRIERCILESNGLAGLRCGTFVGVLITNCDFYNNSSHGIDFNAVTGYSVVKNCNFIKNGGWGINGNNLAYTLDIINCGFGAGTMANTSGQTTGNAINAVGTITYPTDSCPYMDPLNGDFRIKIAEAMDTGYNNYIQQAPSYSGSVGNPPIGAIIVPRTSFLAKGGMLIGGSM